MSRIFITGSSDGLGSAAAQRLVKNGHRVVLHARNAKRAEDARKACPGAETVLIGDLSSIQETKTLAEEANKLGTFDAVIHNAGLFRGAGAHTADGFPSLVAVNVFAPYILTCLMHRPKRLVYLSSSMHNGANTSLKDITFKEQRWNDTQAYSDSKAYNIMFAKAVGRRWKDVQANSMDPGWVATKMGGASAPDSWDASVQTYTMLAENPGASGKYFRPGKREGTPLRGCEDTKAQDRLLQLCEQFTGVKLPE